MNRREKVADVDIIYAREREREKESSQQPQKKRGHTSPSRATLFLFERVVMSSSAKTTQHRRMMRRRRLSSSTSRDEDECERREKLVEKRKEVYFFARVVFVVGVLLLAFFSLKEFEMGRRRQRSSLLVFTRERLRASSERNYLSVAGEVFDVSGGNGDLFYGEGKEYNFSRVCKML